ncbi:MAG: hypothetical protein ACJAWS_000867 [Oleiphilaceae bacterium]|jgi:hypothetical protein
MYFPLIERRNSESDRRDRNVDGHDSHKECRHGNDRRQLKLDKDTVLYFASLHLQDHASQQPQDSQQESKIIKALKYFILPILLASGGSIATWYIAEKQIQSATIISDQQQKSSKILDEGQRENAKKIAEAQISAEYLVHMREIFEDILTADINETIKEIKIEELKQRILSMAVYGDDALPFLLQMKEHFRDKLRHKPDQYSVVSEGLMGAAKATVLKIITGGQLDLSQQLLVGQGQQLNLRQQLYENINFEGSTFSNVNLFSASFKGSSLQYVTFDNVDLERANFETANLEGVKFIKADLKHTNFLKAYLRGATCTDCRGVATALFTFNQLFYNSKSPLFTNIKPDDYVLMFKPHIEEIERRHEQNDGESDIFKEGGKLFENKIKNISQLKDHLLKLSEKSETDTKVAQRSILALN